MLNAFDTDLQDRLTQRFTHKKYEPNPFLDLGSGEGSFSV